MNEVLVVMITPFDLFGYGLYRYTFQMKCEEIPELKLDELLKYMQHSTDEVSGACESKRIQEMHRRVCQIRASEKTEVKYMQTWEEKIQNEKAAEG